MGVWSSIEHVNVTQLPVTMCMYDALTDATASMQQAAADDADVKPAVMSDIKGRM